MRYLALLLLIWSPAVWAESEDVRLETDLGPLYGTLEFTETPAPTAVALIISGSGPTDRDGNSAMLPGKNNSLKYLAEGLLEQGVASLRFDKRLIGESASDQLTEEDLRFEHYITDTEFLAAYLKKRFDLPVFLVGHSEGSLIALIAAKSDDVSGVVSLAGVGQNASQVILDQLRKQLPEPMMQQSETVVDSLVAGELVTEYPPELFSLFRPSVQPYLISWFRYDPAVELAALDCPALLIYGTTDLQVPPSEADFLMRADDTARLVVIEGMNHVLKSVSGTMVEQMGSYSDPELPVVPELVDEVSTFILEESRAGK